jgi:hypothetical protein
MSDKPDRERLIELLKKLGGEDDADVLAAARDVHAQIADTGADWDELLVAAGGPDATDTSEDATDTSEDATDTSEDATDTSEDATDTSEDATDTSEDATDTSEDADYDDVDDGDTGEAANDTPRQGGDMTDAQCLKVIEALLARSDVSEFLREELGGYKDDIKEKEFEASDRAYLHSLNGRLKNSK